MFLQQSAWLGAIAGAPALVRGRNLNGKVQVAAVGCEGMGHTDVHNLARHGKVAFVGFCDIDRRNFARVDKLAPGTPHFVDFREMLAKLGDTVDAVSVSTPDHMHARVAVEAMRRKKHVYVQKPLAQTVWECRQLRLWAEKTGVVTQMGNHGHSSDAAARVNEWIEAGVLGAVREVHIWTNRPIWPQGVPRPMKSAPWQGGGGFGNEWTARRLNRAISTAVVGTRGGVGASMLATSLAWLFSTEHKLPTALLDLDVHFGTGALTLDLEPGRGLTDAIENPSRIDGLFIERAMIRANDNMAMRSARACPTRWTSW